MMKKTVTFLAIGSLGFFMTGCTWFEKDEQATLMQMEQEAIDAETSAILDDLTPELLSVSDRWIDTRAQIARDFNMDYRQWWEDWNKALLLDRQTRLNHRPIP